MNDDDLETVLGEALRPAPVQPPADRVAALRARAEQARAEQAEAPAGTSNDGLDGLDAPDAPDAPLTLRPASRSRLLLGLAAGLVLLAAGAAVGVGLTSGPAGSEQDLLARGTAEFEASLAVDGVEVTLDGSRAPEGRIVVLESDSLPILPLGEYYELWFVGPDDSPGSPDRVSAGTFHPDYDDGYTLVVLHAAVDPTLFPAVEITAEVGDGDPGPSGDVVLEGPLDLIG